MVFIKLQFQDNIKKILIAPEEISWQRICEILSQIFRLEDTNSIHLVYKDDKQFQDIKIKSNEQLLEAINKKVITKFIKFFVYYSGAVEADFAYTSLSDKSSMPNSNNSNIKKKKNKKEQQNGKIQEGKSPPHSQNKNVKQTQDKEEITDNDTIKVENEQELRLVLQKAMGKSLVFEEIKGKIKQFISEQDERAVDELAEQVQYSVQTNYQHLSDLFVQNIKEVIDEEIIKQARNRSGRKLSDNFYDKKSLLRDADGILSKTNYFPSTPFENKEKDLPSFNTSYKINQNENTEIETETPDRFTQSITQDGSDQLECSQLNQEQSVYIWNQKQLKKKTPSCDQLWSRLEEEHLQSILNIENALMQSQMESQAKINEKLEQSIRNVNNLFNTHSKQPQKQKYTSAYQLFVQLDKQVQQFSLSDSFGQTTTCVSHQKEQKDPNKSIDLEDTILQVITPLRSLTVMKKDEKDKDDPQVTIHTNAKQQQIMSSLVTNHFSSPKSISTASSDLPMLIMTKKISHSFIQNA